MNSVKPNRILCARFTPQTLPHKTKSFFLHFPQYHCVCHNNSNVILTILPLRIRDAAVHERVLNATPCQTNANFKDKILKL